jgi:hypothetical protein
MRDFRQSLPLMRSFRRELHWSDDSPELRRAMRRVLARIRSEGPLKARDFENREVRVPGSWTFSKVEKRAIPKSEKTSVARQKLIHDFLRALRSRLDQILKRPDAVKISLHGRDAVSFEDLRSDLSSSGVFLGFLTREYVRSKWFEEETKFFYRPRMDRPNRGSSPTASNPGWRANGRCPRICKSKSKIPPCGAGCSARRTWNRKPTQPPNPSPARSLPYGGASRRSQATVRRQVRPRDLIKPRLREDSRRPVYCSSRVN